MTAEQEKAIRAPLTDAEKVAAKPQSQQVTDVQPKNETTFKVTAQDVTDRINSAPDLDALYMAGDLIGEVDDPDQRIALTGLFDQRKFVLEAS